METATIVILSVLVVLQIVGIVLRFKKSDNGIDAKILFNIAEEGRKTRESLDADSVKSTTIMFQGLKTANDEAFEHIKSISKDNSDNIKEMRTELNNSTNAMREEQKKSISEIREELKASFKDIREELRNTIADVQQKTDGSLKQIREENEKKLDEIKGVVDEKLTKTLNERLQTSFEVVSKQLEAVNKGLGEMQGLTNGMNDLKKVLSGVKNRGTWGEISLESLLGEILAEGQYRKQCPIGQDNNTRRQVDFGIILPGTKENEEVILPVDSKFPIEDFAKLQEACESGNTEEYNTYRKKLKDTIKQFAGDIRDKYIKVPKTTDFAIMYLPIESLYAEVLRIEGLPEELQNSYRVIPAGPTNFAALLNSLRVGFKTVQIQKYSNDMVKILQTFKKDFNAFVGIIGTAQKQVETVKGTLEKAGSKTMAIQKTLNKVENFGIESDEASALPIGNEDSVEDDSI